MRTDAGREISMRWEPHSKHTDFTDLSHNHSLRHARAAPGGNAVNLPEGYRCPGLPILHARQWCGTIDCGLQDFSPTICLPRSACAKWEPFYPCSHLAKSDAPRHCPCREVSWAPAGAARRCGLSTCRGSQGHLGIDLHGAPERNATRSIPGPLYGTSTRSPPS